MKSKRQNEVNQSESKNVDKIAKERIKLWNSRQCVYNGICNNKYVSRSVIIFRSKVKKFLRKFQNQITEDEVEFWKERLNITELAAKTSNKKIESLESNKSEIEVVDNLISSSLGEELHDITEEVIDNITEIEKTNVE